MKEVQVDKFLFFLKVELNYSELTIKSYQLDLTDFFGYIESKKINYLTITNHDVRGYLKYLDSCNLKNSTISRRISTLRTFYNYLVDENIVENNVFHNVKNPKLEKKLPNYLTSEEIDKLFNIRLTKPIDYRNKAMLEIIYATGARISEITSLELKQINFEECIIRVTGKGKKDRIIPIGNTALEALKLYVYNYRAFLVKNVTCDYVFLNKNGTKISRQGFFKILKDLANKSGINKEISPHTLRHSFATNLLNNGADLRVIQELLGHENLETTEIYSHLQNKKIEEDYSNHPHAHI